MKAADVMTRRIISVSPEATVLEAIKLMLKHHISGLPVIGHKGNLVGIVEAVRIMEAHSVKRLPVMRRGNLWASSAAPT